MSESATQEFNKPTQGVVHANVPLKRAAHFLLSSYLHQSPPNDALSRAYAEINVAVDFFAPENNQQADTIKEAHYGFRWCLQNIFRSSWSKYDYFSSTSEDPVAIAGLLAFIYRKPLIFLSDEIKSGSYIGDRSRLWKKLCRWCMRRANITIVNDESRVQLQSDYAGLREEQKVLVYPGCFLKPPAANHRAQQLAEWGTPSDKLVLAYSGGCNLSGGIHWALTALDDFPELVMVTQPLGIDAMNLFLLENHRQQHRLNIAQQRMTWQESWSSMGGVDIGVAIYLNTAPQFLNMGISSNRLCMFLAMGVPVIVTKQPSFAFVEEFDCGVMVSSQQEFNSAVTKILANLDQMKQNALDCTEKYIATQSRYTTLVAQMRSLT